MTEDLQKAIQRMDESIRHYTGVGLPFNAEDAQEAMEKRDTETDQAWQRIRLYLTEEREMLVEHKQQANINRAKEISVIWDKIDRGTLTDEQKELLKELHIPYQYDRRIHRYGMRLRGFSIGCQPKDGFIECEEYSGTPLINAPNRKYHDILRYSHKLTEEEREAYDLDYLGTTEDQKWEEEKKARGWT